MLEENTIEKTGGKYVITVPTKRHEGWILGDGEWEDIT